MSAIGIFFLVMVVVSVIRATRSDVRRGGNLAMAVAWGTWAFGSLMKNEWLYAIGVVPLVLAIYLNMTWRRRTLKAIQRTMGLSDEEVARRDAAYAVKKAEELERRRIEDLERSQREEEQRAFEEAFRVEPRNSPIIVELSLANEICFPVEGGGRLRFGPGDLAGCLQFENATFDEEVNVLKITQVFKDVRSRAWKSVSFVTWESLLAEVLGSQRGESGGGIHLWNDLPEAWQKSMREACLISGATELLVRRDYYSLKLGDRTFTVREKYQTPTIDLAWLSAGNSMLIRVSNLYAVPDEDEGEAEDIPPFVFDLPVSKVGLPTNPGIHWRNAEDWLHFDGDDHRAPEFFLAAASDSFPVSRIEFLDP